MQCMQKQVLNIAGLRALTWSVGRSGVTEACSGRLQAIGISPTA